MLPVLVLFAGAVLCGIVRSRHCRLACWLLLGSAISAVGLILAFEAHDTVIAYGVLTLVLAHSLLGPWAALATAGGLCATAILAVRMRASGMAEGWGPLAFLLLSATAWAATALAERPLKTSVEWALEGWRQAREALAETRERRGELYRVVRALEEATYRIERANNELVLAQHAAEEARALKARFAATVSHELRSPLNLILGFSRLIALSPESYPEPLPRCYRDDVYTIYRNCQHLLALVDDILDLSQVEAQRLPLVKDQVDLEKDVVQKVVDIVEPLAKRKGLALTLALDGDLPPVVADPVRLRQALLNLLVNAVRFTEKGRVEVRAALREDHIEISVCDTGPGISQEDLPRLFREFQHVRSQDMADSSGSGLGLAISKHLIELHGGDIWVESQRGQGTTFSFSVPLPSASPTYGPVVETASAGRRALDHRNCLVVHDDTDITRLLARHIGDYRLVGVPGHERIPDLIEELRPRAIVTTPALTDQVLEQVSQTPFDVPVVSFPLPSVRDQHRWERILAYLIKPISPETVAAVMSHVPQAQELNVLLVDDDPDTVRLLETMLTALPHPYRIHKAYDGAEALASMRRTLPAIVFLDLIMPGLDGAQVVEAMRADDRLAEVPVVMISGRDWIDESIKLGASFSVTCRAPVSLSRGIGCLQALLGALAPDYLGETETSRWSEAGAVDQSASAGRPRRPTPAPGGVD
jgi:signal transduction histidine kinase/CheY-like chemotaxis protein